MRFDFISEDGCLLGSCTFPGFAGGELVNIEATLNGWTLLLRHQSPKVLEEPERGRPTPSFQSAVHPHRAGMAIGGAVMARKCSICTHVECVEIDRLLIACESFLAVF
jgi:hypothetical protein